MDERWVVRDATQQDGDACAAVYAPYVTGTAVSFEAEAPSPAEMAERIAAATGRDPADPAHRFELQTAVTGARLLGWPSSVTP